MICAAGSLIRSVRRHRVARWDVRFLWPVRVGCRGQFGGFADDERFETRSFGASGEQFALDRLASGGFEFSEAVGAEPGATGNSRCASRFHF
jgi:hypothetical protein